ncbi:putative threonine aspartase [Thelohanellus kitauei]|uniref:Putative threonine aspartase n=1 Tax=Thelohanellus kitauei TaxID=669202 RepID=A0A0C2N4I6_THEKT|nr:putative threonine aspartase [Thelohanellus kitauei]
MIAVHFGLGNYSGKADVSKNLTSHLTFICNEICVDLEKGFNSLKSVCHAVSMLENSVYSNAGIGSCLTSQGIVEMEAAVMDGKSRIFGGVSCIRNYQNPIKIAELLLNEQKVYKEKGFVKPQHLSGIGAEEFAHANGLNKCDPMTLITPKSQKIYERMKEIDATLLGNQACDTVGAVCVDKKGRISVAASSGGTACRHEGRIGHVSQPSGSGVWVDNKSRVAACTTGLGELLARDVTARNICRIINQEDTADGLNKHLIGLKDLNPTNWQECVGALGVQVNKNGSKRVVSCISGSKLMVAYCSIGSEPKINVLIPSQTDVHAPVVEEWCIS